MPPWRVCSQDCFEGEHLVVQKLHGISLGLLLSLLLVKLLLLWGGGSLLVIVSTTMVVVMHRCIKCRWSSERTASALGILRPLLQVTFAHEQHIPSIIIVNNYYLPTHLFLLSKPHTYKHAFMSHLEYLCNTSSVATDLSVDFGVKRSISGKK